MAGIQPRTLPPALGRGRLQLRQPNQHQHPARLQHPRSRNYGSHRSVLARHRRQRQPQLPRRPRHRPEHPDFRLRPLHRRTRLSGSYGLLRPGTARPGLCQRPRLRSRYLQRNPRYAALQQLPPQLLQPQLPRLHPRIRGPEKRRQRHPRRPGTHRGDGSNRPNCLGAGLFHPLL